MSKSTKPSRAFNPEAVKKKVKEHRFAESLPDRQFYMQLCECFKPETFDSTSSTHTNFYNSFTKSVEGLLELYNKVLEHKFCNNGHNEQFYKSFKELTEASSGQKMVSLYNVFYWYHLTGNIKEQFRGNQEAHARAKKLLGMLKGTFDKINKKQKAEYRKSGQTYKTIRLFIALALIATILILHFTGVIDIM